jgi:predicted enzyme related to lactoylglutathione lyase
MATLPKPGAVLFAKDVASMAKFYEALLNMSVNLRQDDLVVLETMTFQLVIHGIPKVIADTFTITVPPQLREEVPAKLIFPVASLTSVRENVVRLGGGMFGKNREFERNGFRACDGYDPEGNVVQFREAVAP